MVTLNRFEEIVQNIFAKLPKVFGEKIDNVHIVVEDSPSSETIKKIRAGKNSLLGLYQGIPLTQRGTWYGVYPTIPDTITLYKSNIEAVCTTENELYDRIEEVLLHELGHYFGMSEDQVRNAMKHYQSSTN
ncbi:MAG: metallopeptidase family protein [Bacteroidota bacterium]